MPKAKTYTRVGKVNKSARSMQVGKIGGRKSNNCVKTMSYEALEAAYTAKNTRPRDMNKIKNEIDRRNPTFVPQEHVYALSI